MISQGNAPFGAVSSRRLDLGTRWGCPKAQSLGYVQVGQGGGGVEGGAGAGWGWGGAGEGRQVHGDRRS